VPSGQKQAYTSSNDDDDDAGGGGGDDDDDDDDDDDYDDDKYTQNDAIIARVDAVHLNIEQHQAAGDPLTKPPSQPVHCHHLHSALLVYAQNTTHAFDVKKIFDVK